MLQPKNQPLFNMPPENPMTHSEDIDDIADKLDGDLGAACAVPLRPRRRNRCTKAGKTSSLSLRRKVEFVVQAILAGRPDSPTALACLSGPDAGAVRHGVWRRARRNPVVALYLSDDWKRRAEEYATQQRKIV